MPNEHFSISKHSSSSLYIYILLSITIMVSVFTYIYIRYAEHIMFIVYYRTFLTGYTYIYIYIYMVSLCKSSIRVKDVKVKFIPRDIAHTQRITEIVLSYTDRHWMKTLLLLFIRWTYHVRIYRNIIYGYKDRNSLLHSKSILLYQTDRHALKETFNILLSTVIFLIIFIIV